MNDETVAHRRGAIERAYRVIPSDFCLRVERTLTRAEFQLHLLREELKRQETHNGAFSCIREALEHVSEDLAGLREDAYHEQDAEHEDFCLDSAWLMREFVSLYVAWATPELSFWAWLERSWGAEVEENIARERQQRAGV